MVSLFCEVMAFLIFLHGPHGLIAASNQNQRKLSSFIEKAMSHQIADNVQSEQLQKMLDQTTNAQNNDIGRHLVHYYPQRYQSFDYYHRPHNHHRHRHRHHHYNNDCKGPCPTPCPTPWPTPLPTPSPTSVCKADSCNGNGKCVAKGKDANDFECECEDGWTKSSNCKETICESKIKQFESGIHLSDDEKKAVFNCLKEIFEKSLNQKIEDNECDIDNFIHENGKIISLSFTFDGLTEEEMNKISNLFRPKFAELRNGKVDEIMIDWNEDDESCGDDKRRRLPFWSRIRRRIVMSFRRRMKRLQVCCNIGNPMCRENNRGRVKRKCKRYDRLTTRFPVCDYTGLGLISAHNKKHLLDAFPGMTTAKQYELNWNENVCEDMQLSGQRGIICDKCGFITRLDLKLQRISGTVNWKALGKLKKLEYIDLQSNDFFGELHLEELPASVKFLKINFNEQFTGKVYVNQLPASIEKFYARQTGTTAKYDIQFACPRTRSKILPHLIYFVVGDYVANDQPLSRIISCEDDNLFGTFASACSLGASGSWYYLLCN